MKLKKFWLLGIIFVGLLALIVGTGVLLHHNFNFIGKFDNTIHVIDIYVSGSYAYVADESDGLRIIDISDATAPVETGQFNDGGEAFGVYVSGSYAYVADYDNSLEIIDISNAPKTKPVTKFNRSTKA